MPSPFQPAAPTLPISIQGGAKFAKALSVLEGAIANQAFPGCAFGALVDGEVVLYGALGHFTYEDSSPKVEASTLFDVASVTKVVATTSVAMLLYQRGQLELEMLLGDVLPGFVVGRDTAEHARRVTIRHLLAHSSGLPGYVPLYHTAGTPTEIVRRCLNLPLEAEPGTRFEYSDPGFILLGKALETISGEDLATFMHGEISEPLGLTHSGFCPPAGIRSQIPPTETDELFRQKVVQGEVQDEHAFLMRGVAGHAGLFSNVSDLLRFSSSILGSHAIRIFAPNVVELFAERQGPPGSSRALGWDTPSQPSSSGSRFSARSIGHLGYSGCSLWIDRDASISVVLLTNRTWPNRESQQIRAVRPLFHDAVREGLEGI